MIGENPVSYHDGLSYPQPQIIEMLRLLLASAEVVVEHADELNILVAAQSPPETNLADYLVVWAGLRDGCRKVITFDRKAARAIPGMELLA
ncbi:hypothetical protein [Rhizobium sullae]|uniref:PIN domain-containing protein n=1 Tax=Rhizobium sullae TaxID=50338 RepID=A0ABY5XFV3_RHISU|nr:hypothetical protein [Rhizobium sullae]UWU13333.1 hypothetical protein N2599_14390 [Rhizobium sullae]